MLLNWSIVVLNSFVMTANYLDLHFFLFLRLTTLSSMSASDELDDNQVRQMLFDLESAYNAFNRFLHSS